MANSNMYKLGTKSQYMNTYSKNITKMVNELKESTTATTSALANDTFYVYKDGYTSNANGSNKGTTNGYRIKVVVFVAAPDTTKRTVTYRVSVFFCRSDGYSSTNTLNLTMKATKANKTEQTSKNLTLSNSAGWVLAQEVKGISLTYPDSGTLTETIQITGNNSPSTSCKSITCEFTFQLPTIEAPLTAARTVPNPRTLTLGSSATKMNNLAIEADKADMKVDLKITLLNADGSDSNQVSTILTKSTARTYSWIAPIAWANAMPDRTSASARMTLTSFKSDGTTQIGNSRNALITVNVPELNDSENPTGIKVTAIDVSASDGGKLIIGQTVPTISIALDKTNARGATVTKVECTVGSETKTANSETTSFTMDNKIVSESTIVRVTVTDSRGRTHSLSKSVTGSNPIAAMSIIDLAASRGTGSDSSFVPNDEGTVAKVTFSLSSPQIKSEGPSGSRIFKARYFLRATNEGTMGAVSYDVPSNNIQLNRDEGTATGEIYISGLEQSKSYIIKLVASDTNFSDQQSRETIVSTAFYFLEFHKSGTGIGIGQAANANKFDVALPTQFHSTVVNSSGSAITSDERKKEDISSIDPMIDKLLKLYKEVDPITFRYKEEVAKYQDDALIHFGFSANKFKDAMEHAGIDSDEFSIVQEYEDRKKDPNTMEEIVENFLAMKYDEITPLNFLMIKFILKELININDRLKEVEKNGKNNDRKE